MTVVWLLIAAACRAPEPPTTASHEAEPPRWVSLAPAISEVVAATAPERLVGYDAYSADLLARDGVVDVGNPRRLSTEGILSLAPTGVLYDDEAGPPEVLEQLRAAGIPTHAIDHDYSLDGVRTLIRQTGEVTGADTSAVLERFDTSCAAVSPSTQPGRTAMFVYARGPGTMSLSGTGTSSHAMLGLAGLVNALPEHEGYKPLTAEAAVAANPDWVVLTTLGLERAGGVDGLRAVPGLAELAAVTEGRVATVDDFQLLAFGLSTCDGVRALADATRG